VEIISEINDFKILSQKLSLKSKKLTQGKSIFLISNKIDWNIEWVNKTVHKIEELNTIDSNIAVVFLADPFRLWKIMDDWHKLSEIGAQILYLHPWREPALRQWLTDSPIGSLSADIRNKISKTTGNWQFLLQKVLEKADGGKIDERTLAEFETEWFDNKSNLLKLKKMFGLTILGNYNIFKIMVELDDEMNADDIIELSDGLFHAGNRKEIEKTFLWASNLDLMTVHRGYRLDRIVAKIITRLASQD